METNYILDSPDIDLAMVVKRFCDLSEIEPPRQGVEFIALLKLGFGRYPFETLENAFTHWMVNKTDIRPVKICNIKWISDVLNDYIERNAHTIKKKPKYPQMALESPKEEPVDYMSVARRMFAIIESDHKATIFPSVFASAWDSLPPTMVEETEYLRYLELIENREAYQVIRSTMLIGKHKVKRDKLNQDIIEKAASMMAYLKTQC
jgi:hypothetical protein